MNYLDTDPAIQARNEGYSDAYHGLNVNKAYVKNTNYLLGYQSGMTDRAIAQVPGKPQDEAKDNEEF